MILRFFLSFLLLHFVGFTAAQTAQDTVIDKRHYQWVKYDLNRNPYEIGQLFTNGIKNGNWLFRDQQGRLVANVFYLNDTLNGAAVYYTHLNPPEIVKMEGLVLKGKKTGIWLCKSRESKFKRWRTFFILMYDANEQLLSRTYTYKNGKPKMQVFYSADGKEIWYRYFKKSGKMYKEDNICPWEITNMGAL